MRHNVRRLSEDARGASLVEFALVLPLLVLLVSGIADLGRGLSERFTLQQAVNRSLELLQAHPPRAGANADSVDYSHLAEQAAAAADVSLDHVTISQWLECDNERQSAFDDSCAADEETARYLRLRIDKDFNGTFFLGTYPMVATGAVRVQ